MNKFGFNNEWVKSTTLPEFKDWCAGNQAKHEMSDTDIEAYWNSLQPVKPPQPVKATKKNDNGGNEAKPVES